MTRARRQQEAWRAQHEWDRGQHDGWLAMPQAELEGWNYLTPGIRALVKSEVERNMFVRDQRSKKLLSCPRLFENMLSSQPMCFNLFGELALDVDLATQVFHHIYPQHVAQVQEIRFEYSPGRRDPRYLSNKSAADAFVVHTTPSGGRGFIAIETKYVEDMSSSPGEWDKDRYGPVVAWANAWREGGPPTEGRGLQITLDHLLTLSMLRANDGWERGMFLLIYPDANVACAQEALRYRARLKPGIQTFSTRSLEYLHETLANICHDPWVAEFGERYLGELALGPACECGHVLWTHVNGSCWSSDNCVCSRRYLTLHDDEGWQELMFDFMADW